MLYRMIQLLARFQLSFFHPSITVRCVQGSKLEEEKPLIVVGNHIRGLPDILHIGARYNRKLWMIGNSTLPMFWGPLESISPRIFPVLPVYRPYEGADGSKNDNLFERGAELLENGNAMVIFPSRNHPVRRWIDPFKTGAVRIAFAAMEKSDWSIDLQIQPVGLNYSGFGESPAVTILVGQTVSVREWRTRYEQDSQAAVRELTEYLESRVKELTVQVEDESLDPLVEQISQVFEIRNPDDQDRLRRTGEALEQLAVVDQDRLEEISHRVTSHVKLARSYGISAAVEEKPLKGVSGFILAVLILFGFLFHAIPLWIDRGMAKLVAVFTDPYYVHSIRCVLAPVVYPAWYIFCGLMLFHLGLPAYFVAGGLCLMALLGWFTIRLISRVMLFWLTWIIPRRIEAHLKKAEELRDDLLAIEESLRQAA